MKRQPKSPTQAELLAAIERPVLSRREQESRRRFSSAGMLQRPAEHGWDPLEMRLGLRAERRDFRPYFAISSPLYHEILLRHPEDDDSLPGPGWLRTLYRGNRRDRLVLPGVLTMLLARRAAADAAWRASLRPKAPASPESPQPDLFAAEVA